MICCDGDTAVMHADAETLLSEMDVESCGSSSGGPHRYEPRQPVVHIEDWRAPPRATADLFDALFTREARHLVARHGWPQETAARFDDDDVYTHHWACQRVDPVTHKCSPSLTGGVKLKLCDVSAATIRVAASHQPWHLVVSNARFDVGDPAQFDEMRLVIPGQRDGYDLPLSLLLLQTGGGGEAQRRRILNLEALAGRDTWCYVTSRSEMIFEFGDSGGGGGGVFVLNTTGRCDAHIGRGYVELWCPTLVSPRPMPFRYCVVNTPTLYALSLVVEGVDSRRLHNDLLRQTSAVTSEPRYASTRMGYATDMERFWLLRQLRAHGSAADNVPRFFLGASQLMVRRDSEDDEASTWTLFHNNRALCELRMLATENDLYFTLLYEEESYPGSLLDYYVYQ